MSRGELLGRAAHLAGLWGLAVVLPLFGLLGDRPEFFTARGATGREIVAREEPRRAGDPPQLVASNERARTALGWAPEKTLEDMIRDAWAWHQAHPDGY